MHGGLLCIAFYLSVCLSVRLCKLLEQKSLEKMSLEKIHISATVQLRVMKVKWVKPGLKVMILADGLTPTSSCIYDIISYSYDIIDQ